MGSMGGGRTIEEAFPALACPEDVAEEGEDAVARGKKKYTIMARISFQDRGEADPAAAAATVI